MDIVPTDANEREETWQRRRIEAVLLRYVFLIGIIGLTLLLAGVLVYNGMVLGMSLTIVTGIIGWISVKAVSVSWKHSAPTPPSVIAFVVASLLTVAPQVFMVYGYVPVWSNDYIAVDSVSGKPVRFIHVDSQTWILPAAWNGAEERNWYADRFTVTTRCLTASCNDARLIPKISFGGAPALLDFEVEVSRADVFEDVMHTRPELLQANLSELKTEYQHNIVIYTDPGNRTAAAIFDGLASLPFGSVDELKLFMEQSASPGYAVRVVLLDVQPQTTTFTYRAPAP